MFFLSQTLRAVEALSTVLNKGLLNAELIPLVVGMSKDHVPNIRFNVAKCFENVKETLDADIVKKDVIPCLSTMQSDEDEDVRYFSTKAMEIFVG